MSIHDLRKRFVKDNKFQIPVLQSPYFEYFLSTYNPLYDSLKKYDDFLEDVELAGGEEAYLKKSFSLVDKIAEYIKSKESYQNFNSEKLDIYNIPQINIPSKDIFSITNRGKTFISIDLKQANFHALKFYDSNIVDNKDTYEDFISQFTDIKHVIKSKYLRQVLFGKLNPKRISKVETFVTYQFLQEILKILNENQIKFFSHDEIVLELKEGFSDFSNFEYVISEKSKELKMPVKIQTFKLVAQTPYKKLGFVKEIISEIIFDNNKNEFFKKTHEFKGVSEIFFAQAYKKYFNLELQDEDLLFYHEGQIVKFLESIKEDAEEITK